MDNDSIIISAIGGTCCLGLVGAVGLVILGTIFKWPIGLKLGPSKCGDCGESAPFVRAPTDAYETLWGGWTCPECGGKNDKWGRLRDVKRGRPRRRRSRRRD